MRLCDLHLHTTASDGTDTPRELTALAKQKGLGIISITDHDTLAGIKEVRNSDTKGIKIVTGVELSCHAYTHKGFHCHILGYGFDPDSEVMRSAIEHSMEMRLYKFEKRLEYIKDIHGIEFNEDEIKSLRELNSVAKPHIAALLVARGLAESVADAIEKYLKDDKFPDGRIDAEEAINAIKNAGGISVYAHPLGGELEKRLNEKELVRRVGILTDMGIDGLECYYSRYSDTDISLLLKTAESYGLTVSGGSDYHGGNKTVVLGELSADGASVSEDRISILKRLNID